MDKSKLNGLIPLVLVAAVLLPSSTAMRANPHQPVILKAHADLDTGVLAIWGEGFGTTADSVLLGDTGLDVQSWAPGEIVAQLPAGITSGTYLLRVLAGKGSTSLDIAMAVDPLPTANRFVAGSVSGVVDLGLDMTMPFLDGATSSNTIVVASGWGDNGTGTSPIIVDGEVTSPTTVHLSVYDGDGVPYNMAMWTSLEIRYAVFLVE